MISAINNNNPTFTSVIPLRVKIDGMESFNPKVIKSCIRQLNSVLAGPSKNNPQKLNIIRKFAQHDPDYKFEFGLNGYPKQNNKNITPSDYFRCIADRRGNFLFTGLQGVKLKEFGKAVGAEQQACKARGIATSFDLKVAKSNYCNAINNYIRLKHLRICESFDSLLKQKLGKPVELLINMKSNGKYGQSNFKMQLEDIVFLTKSS